MDSIIRIVAIFWNLFWNAGTVFWNGLRSAAAALGNWLRTGWAYWWNGYVDYISELAVGHPGIMAGVILGLFLCILFLLLALYCSVLKHTVKYSHSKLEKLLEGDPEESTDYSLLKWVLIVLAVGVAVVFIFTGIELTVG